MIIFTETRAGGLIDNDCYLPISCYQLDSLLYWTPLANFFCNDPDMGTAVGWPPLPWLDSDFEASFLKAENMMEHPVSCEYVGQNFHSIYQLFPGLEHLSVMTRPCTASLFMDKPEQ